jgi:hypothetical protein
LIYHKVILLHNALAREDVQLNRDYLPICSFNSGNCLKIADVFEMPNFVSDNCLKSALNFNHSFNSKKMNLAQTKIYLEKIIALYKSMSADERNISPIERDLMLSYIRQLYETCLDAPAVSPIQQASAPVKPPPMPPPPPPKVEPPVAAAPKYTPPPPPAPEPVQYTPPPVVEQPRYVAPPPPVVEQPRYVAPPPPPPPAPEPPPRPRAHHAPSSGFSAEVEALFDEQVGKEISDRIANAPIADLGRAFGVNDRLLMQNELFLNNKNAFDEALKDLNNASSFETAKAFLADLAVRNNWNLNGDRQKHAKAFIKTVRRRFK